jgi:hypothetical protein
MTDLFSTYQDTYLAIRARYGHPDAPVLYMGKVYCETLPPKVWDRATHASYFDEVSRLTGWYLEARRYAAKRRKTTADRAAYLATCDRFSIAGHDLLFAGEPAQTALL